jgi:hypothetical protein
LVAAALGVVAEGGARSVGVVAEAASPAVGVAGFVVGVVMMAAA